MQTQEMKTVFVVMKNNFSSFLKTVMEAGYSIAAPLYKDKILDFGFTNDVNDIVLSDELPYKSPKEFFFPQQEKLISFDLEGNLESYAEGLKLRPFVLLGVKPCDLQALEVVKKIFLDWKYTDPYFNERTKNSIVFGKGCNIKKKGCFCDERNINLNFSSKCDVFIRETDSEYLFEAITEKGNVFLKNFLPEEPRSTFIDDKVVPSSPSSDDIKELKLDINEDELFSRESWETLSEKCLGCGMCTYICPTCHCFGFRDAEENGKQIRYRCWDSCMYPRFTLHASGHNPRISRKERFRQRVMHKYSYVKKNTGMIACTGCGRCIRSCPGGMNIKTVVKKLMEEKHPKSMKAGMEANNG
ncbi:MAG: 4Fe-4S dicluster domain-containing protein [Clostridiales bacterium]|nr:4Fe-4S dicluster domain-containing protein [Clostridiales bacterium]